MSYSLPLCTFPMQWNLYSGMLSVGTQIPVAQNTPNITGITNTGFLEHTVNSASSVLCHCVQWVSDTVLVCINAKLEAIDPNKHLYFVFAVSPVCLIHKYVYFMSKTEWRIYFS